MSAPILKYFQFAHLPENLKKVSQPFAVLAAEMDETLPDGPEKSAGLRKLLEAKDCAVRAALGLRRKAAIGLKTYLVDGGHLLFQFPYPRLERQSEHILNLLMSMIYHTYAIGDFEGASVSIADLSRIDNLSASSSKFPRARQPRIVRLETKNLISMEAMTPDIQSVHDLLLELGDEEE